MKIYNLYIVFITLLFSCTQQKVDKNIIARVYDNYLYEDDIALKIPDKLSKEDSLVFRNSLINAWATEQLLLEKAKINIEDKYEEINKLVDNYRKDLIVDKYKKAVLQQELDTLLTIADIDDYYKKNREIYKLNEDLIQLKYVHFSTELNDKKEIIKLFKSKEKDDFNELESRNLEFNSFNFNDSIWISYNKAIEKLPFLKNKKKIKNNNFIQKEDSLGVYLVAIKNILKRNDIAPKSYVMPLIRQMILHKRKLELTKKIEQTLVNDAINKKQFEQY